MRYGFGYFEEDQLGRFADTGIWRRIIAYSRPYLLKMIVAVLLSIVVIGAGLALPYMVRLGIDRFIVATDLAPAVRIDGLARLAVLFVGVILGGFAANFSQVFLLEWIGQAIMHRLRQQLFGHLLDLDLAFFNNNPAGKLVTRLTNDIQNMHEMFTSVIVTLFNDFIQLAGIMVILYWMNWRLALILTLLVPFIIGNTLWFSRLARDVFRVIRTRLARINAFLQESLSGIAVLQLFLREKETREKFVELNQAYLEKNLHQIRLFAIFMPAIELFSAIALAAIIWYGGGSVIREQMTLGELSAFIAYMRLFFQPIRELSQKYSIVQSAMASAERIFELLDTTPSLPAGTIRTKTPADAGRVEFRHVSFSYAPGAPVLHDLSFVVRPGTTLAIVGATGSGKSTIVQLLERFYDPDNGEILLDGRNLREFDSRWLRGRMGLVMQEVFIIPGTIRDNILLGRELTEEQVATITRQAQLTGLISRLSEGLATLIGEGGMDLSAGEKQLLAFARVLARDPEVLILDEATASVDSETEMRIDRAIASTLAGRTSIVIAHRLSTIRRADTIVVMEQGRIREQGRHEELLAKGGLYRRLHDLQLSGNGENSAMNDPSPPKTAS
ncbi:MAG: ABC transporter ATP-binding protein [Thermodesulfobacteriota bacterium]